MSIKVYHPEERQALRDEAFVRAEREMLEWQEWEEHMAKTRIRRPAKIEVIENDTVTIDNLPF